MTEIPNIGTAPIAENINKDCKNEIKAESTVISRLNEPENTGDTLLIVEISALIIGVLCLVITLLKKKNYS